MSSESYRTILRSSSIIGGSQVANIAISLVKMKVVAVLLGPAGVGLAGLYMNLVQTAAAISALGFGNVGTRQIAAASAEGGVEAVGETRRALFWGTLILSLVGALLFWLSSGFIARHVLEEPARANDVAWLSIGVALSVAAGSQGALLTGLRRVGDLARINVASAAAAAVLGVLALWLWGTAGLLPMVLAAPLATFLLGHVYVARLGPPSGQPLSMKRLAVHWRELATLGFAFMISGLALTLGQLAVRTMVQRELGSAPLGQFQAAWAIGSTYLGFVLGAMGTDYYPRLSGVIKDKEAATRLVNEQTEVALLLCAPPLLALLGLAPWVIHLLYTADFAPAAEILRWQLLGDVLKVMSWPLGFVILAAGAGKTFVLTESLAVLVFATGVFVGLPLMGINATGAAYFAMYVAYLPAVWGLGVRRIGFRWTSAVKRQALLILLAAAAVELACRSSEPAGATAGILLAGIMGIHALRSVRRLRAPSAK